MITTGAGLQVKDCLPVIKTVKNYEVGRKSEKADFSREIFLLV